MTAEEIIALGFVHPIQHTSGEWCAVQKFMFTCGIVIGINEFGYRCRWCYGFAGDAMIAHLTWDGTGDDPSGPWIKQKGINSEGKPVDRSNPNKLYHYDSEFE